MGANIGTAQAVIADVTPQRDRARGMGLVGMAFGLGFATVTSSTSALVADLTRNGRFGSSMGVLRTVMDVGQSIGPVLTGWMVSSAGYAQAFFLLAAILLGAALLLGAGMEKERPARN